MVIVEQAFEHLKAPIMRLAGRNSSIPFSNSIEKGFWPDADSIAGAVRAVMAY
jgi:pyruvate/2-oxoglutarate/acetoin dehydrogenase E1 component